MEKTLGGNGSNTSMVEKQAAYNFMSGIHDKLFDLMERVIGIQDPVLKKMYNNRIKETRKRLVTAEAAYKKVCGDDGRVLLYNQLDNVNRCLTATRTV